jgi:hypothetical protein
LKKTVLILAALLLLLCGCGRSSRMPFNGQVTFHEITATIPDSFVRDSTQSSDDLWVFEHGGYSKMILLSRTDVAGDADAALDDYVAYMQSLGADAERGRFLNADAVHSTYTRDGQYCQEILFVYQGSFYAVALRGGTEEEFQSLLDEVNTPETAL